MSRTPHTDAYLAGGDNLETAALELIALMPLHGTLFGPDGPQSSEAAERGRLLEARMRVILAELRAGRSSGTT